MKSVQLIRAALAMLCATAAPAACANTTKEVIEPSKQYRLPKRPAGASDGHVVAYDSRGRGAYIKVNALMKVCAEPPPDASANLDAKSDLSTTLKALVEYEAISATIDGSLQRSQAASSSIADVATRTELVLFMRDALYRVCELHFNGVLNPADARRAFTDVIAAGRVLGQRDNVGKLVELARALIAATVPDPALIHDVIGTIRFLAVSDYLLANRADEKTEALATVLLKEVLGSANIADARRTLLEKLRGQRESHEKKIDEANDVEAKGKEKGLTTEKKKDLDEQKKALAGEIEKIEEEHEVTRETYRTLFDVAPPPDVTIGGATGDDAIK